VCGTCSLGAAFGENYGSGPSLRENDFECFASTGVKSPGNAILERSASDRRPAVRPDPRLTTWFSTRSSV